MSIARHRSLWRNWRRIGFGLGLISMMLSSALLAGCQPPAEPTLPPATAVQVAPATAKVAIPPTATYEPTATTKPTDMPAPTTQPSETAAPKQSVALTILHTNDVLGEVDPCG